MGVGSRVADLFDESVAPSSTWYCDKPTCDGKPHRGWDHNHARVAQRPPAAFVAGEARVWVMMAGRGFGKTRAGAEWIAHEARSTPNSEWAVVAPTFDAVKRVCFGEDGDAGILTALGMRRSDDRYNKSSGLIRLDNDAVIVGYSAEAPTAGRGPNLYGLWADEIAQWSSSEMYDNLFPALRKGRAQTVVTTTPAPVPLLLQFTSRDDGSVVTSGGSTFDNAENLTPSAVADLELRWSGTRKEKQELYGLLLEDVPGALWSAAKIESTRAVLLPD
jgi:phage terminase large subunit-like protein